MQEQKQHRNINFQSHISSKMDFFAWVLFAAAAGMSGWVWKQNLSLIEELRLSEQRIGDLEGHRSLNQESVTDIIKRMTNAEDTSAILRPLQTQLGAVQSQLNTLQKEVSINQESIKVHTSDIKLVYGHHKALEANTVHFDDANICVMASNTVCPIGMTRTGTFGIISYNPEHLVGTGLYLKGQFSDNWDWLHGGFCCKTAAVVPPEEAK
jgi:hypothetical protein